MANPLTDGFRDIIELRWSDFLRVEQDEGGDNFEAIITALVRACKKSNLRAAQVALDRLDGKVVQELEVEYPKFYTLYPEATKTADDPAIIDYDENDKLLVEQINNSYDLQPNGSPADVEEQMAAEEELPTGSLRVVLEKMLHSPKSIVKDIMLAAEAIEEGNWSKGDPMVKSVIVAGLMKLVHEGRMNAVFEVFDRVDGKIKETLKIIGEDVYIMNYAKIAPAGAIKNADGIYQVEANNTTDSWAARLESSRKK